MIEQFANEVKVTTFIPEPGKTANICNIKCAKVKIKKSHKRSNILSYEKFYPLDVNVQAADTCSLHQQMFRTYSHINQCCLIRNTV